MCDHFSNFVIKNRSAGGHVLAWRGGLGYASSLVGQAVDWQKKKKKVLAALVSVHNTYLTLGGTDRYENSR